MPAGIGIWTGRQEQRVSFRIFVSHRRYAMRRSARSSFASLEFEPKKNGEAVFVGRQHRRSLEQITLNFLAQVAPGVKHVGAFPYVGDASRWRAVRTEIKVSAADTPRSLTHRACSCGSTRAGIYPARSRGHRTSRARAEVGPVPSRSSGAMPLRCGQRQFRCVRPSPSARSRNVDSLQCDAHTRRWYRPIPWCLKSPTALEARLSSIM